ncbi:helix-turn-helix DNA-binding domain protein [Streptomyces phage Comrade]|uniref:Helix-turn-helix DNA-binding domain protein n=3 Tax=Gilsonvirus comrade TaxID=2846395 RepID=A0A345MDY6_9CAUD|nr:helix-turn-helix DNA binding domain protein [Streptomyces phage Comrade]AXH68767.1 helix-turn-helix DNA-binding domain protein [Streptomyces phage SparkleGoddess]AXQ63324.1 helix-turn-helix DNA-binding domain protein [Streptomyces phage Comrade]QQO39738.1 MerR-like helix-turn-helix DNA binding domain protein [Streptomyces phage Belfort]
MHKVLSVTRAQDFAICWNFREGKRAGYIWSDLRRNAERAFKMQEVSAMIGRHRVNIERDILAGNIKAPQRSYTLDGNKRPLYYFFSEKDVLDLHDYLLTIHIGRPRKDGKITPANMPSKTELRAMMRHDMVTYVKTEGGEFVPVWKEQSW